MTHGDELLNTDNGCNDPGRIPRRRRDQTSGQAVLWVARAAVNFDSDSDGDFWGAYPRGFESWAACAMGVQPDQVIHICSGRLPAGSGRLRVDLRVCVHPDVVADARALPLRDACGDAVLIDPPYTVEYARDLYNTTYPRPSALLAEAVRIARPSAPIGFLHFLVPMPPRGAPLERVYGITTGAGYRIRALSIFRKAQAELW